MAELLVSSLAKAVLEALKESLELRGARGLNLERPTSRDTPLVPELQLNMCILSELFVQILSSGLGALILVWATVVLLGGFSSSLEGVDFWVITAIVFIQTARVVGINVSPEAEFFNQVPAAFFEMVAKQYATWGRRLSTGKTTGQKFLFYFMLALGISKDYISIMAFLSILVLAVPVMAGLGCISLSIYRLAALLTRHRDNSNVLRALILFYALVLLQGGLFIIWLRLRLSRSYIANIVSSKYKFEDKRELIDKYMGRTLRTAIKNGVSSTINRNLASFAADLIKSDYSQDHIDTVLVIHTLVSQEEHRTRTLSQIQSSPLCVSRLLDMVASKSRTDQRIKVCIAEIVAHLASNLRLADISGATESISSMIDPYFTKIPTSAADIDIDHQTTIDITIDQQVTNQSASTTSGALNIRDIISFKQLRERRSAALKDRARNIAISQQGTLQPLIIHGLLILAKLVVNPDNCKQIYDSKGLFSKIISPVKNKVYEISSYDDITMEIAEKALEVVSMFVSGRDETNGKIRQDICSNQIAVNDIRPILERGEEYNKIKVPAIKILTELYLDMSTRATTGLDDIAEFIKFLTNIFFDAANDSGLRKTTGEALAVLAMDNANCMMIMNSSTGQTSVQLLTAMMFLSNGRLYQTSIAQMLTQFCANSDTNTKGEILKSVKPILHEVLKVICNVEEAANAHQPGSPQHNLGQQKAANTNQEGSSQPNPGQQQAAKEYQAGSPQHNLGQQQAGNTNQADSPQHNPDQPPLHFPTLIRHRLIHYLRPQRSHTANRNAPGDNLPAVARLAGGKRKSLAAFLGLFMQISEKLKISALDFETALADIPLSMDEFVDKLNYIIEQCKGQFVDSLERKAPSVDYLIIIRTITKLCKWMMQCKPDCITVFQAKKTSFKLQGALEDMRELELGMLLTGSTGYIANYQTLSMAGTDARKMMDANVH